MCSSDLFANLPVVDFGWPGIDITLFGETFKWNILGYDAAHELPFSGTAKVLPVTGISSSLPSFL